MNQYQVEPSAPPETLAVSFLFPHTTDPTTAPWIQGAVGCLHWKRLADLWDTSFYLPHNDVAQGTPSPQQFTADVQVAAAALQEAREPNVCLAFWDAVRNSAMAANAPGEARAT